VTVSTTEAISSGGESTFDWIDVRSEARAKAGLSRRLRPRTSDSTDLDLASNDYLGLAKDKRVAGAAAAATLKWGSGSTGSRLVTGSTELHAELEFELANFCGSQSALVFSSGYMANLGAHIHASLIDGTRLSKADVVVADHCDVGKVRHALETRGKRRAIVVTDSVFSVDGDIAPLNELHEACRATGAALVVDDAHGLGVVGPGGRGAVAAAGIVKAPDVITTLTLSKSLGAQGGAVLGPSRVIKHLIDTARPFIFDTGLAPSSVAAALAAIRILREEPDRPERALTVAHDLSNRLKEAGFEVSTPTAAVVSVRAPSPEQAFQWAENCRTSGVVVGCFRPPSVPDQISRLRLTARADLTEADIERAVRVIRESAASAGVESRPR
jgi:8-amino-7-oxononanoate synthase